MDESLKNKWWWYGHWGNDGATCAKDVHKYLPKEWPKKLVGDTSTKKPTNETNEAHPIDHKRKQVADPEDAGPTDSKKTSQEETQTCQTPVRIQFLGR